VKNNGSTAEFAATLASPNGNQKQLRQAMNLKTNRVWLRQQLKERKMKTYKRQELQPTEWNMGEKTSLR